jgi:hypothetical protein
MKPRKITILVMLLGLLLLAFAVGVAQTPSQGDQNKKPDACCAMDSCCCSGDSCSLKQDGSATTDAKPDVAARPDCCKGDSCKMHKKDMNHADGHECCGCCADSCDMDMKADGTMKHDMKDMKHDMKGHKGDCCKAKSKEAKDKNKQ